jgi:hypothetical protein
MKNIDNYFNEWTHVETDSHVDRPGWDDWCVANIGIRALKWDRYVPKYNVIVPVRKILNVVYRFKHEEDAMMFLLKFSGRVITINDK